MKPSGISYNDAAQRIRNEKEYNSVVRETHVKNHLNELRIEKFMVDGTYMATSLANIDKLVLTMSLQVPESHRGGAHKAEILRTAAVRHSWAHEPLGQNATSGLSFQQLYSELKIAVLLEKESSAITLNTIPIPSFPRSDISKVHFSGQGRCVHSFEHGRKQNRFRNQKRSCFNCRSTSHLVRNCPRAVYFSRATANRIRDLGRDNTQNAVYIVLAHLCDELDSPECTTEDTGDTQNDSEIFEELVVSDLAGASGNHEDSNTDAELGNLNIFSTHVDCMPTSNNFLGRLHRFGSSTYRNWIPTSVDQYANYW